jgi:hypothetical protein
VLTLFSCVCCPKEVLVSVCVLQELVAGVYFMLGTGLLPGSSSPGFIYGSPNWELECEGAK